MIQIKISFKILSSQTANSTQWILYLLARNPNLQEELHAELQKVYGCDEVAQLPLLRGVVKEALRLYPTAPFLTRYLPQDNLIGGYHVPAGVSIICWNFNLNFIILDRNATYWLPTFSQYASYKYFCECQQTFFSI